MNNRIQRAFAKAKAEKRGAFVAYLTIGYPTLEASEEAASRLVADGADVLELGVPFSDPFADGAVIRSASYRALENGVTLDDVLGVAARVRAKHPATGLVLFTYYNLIFAKGLEAFGEAAAEAGIDAVLAVDLPFEEREELLAVLRPRGVGYIPLAGPGTPLERVVASSKGVGDGFMYVITVKGTTGARRELPEDLARRLEAVRGAVELPIAAGFGISTREQALEVSRHADGYVVGSAIVRQLATPPIPAHLW